MYEDKIASVNQFADDHPVIYEKRTYTVNEIQDVLGISRNSAYLLVKSGAFRTVRIGGSIRVSKKSFDAWLDENCQVCD